MGAENYNNKEELTYKDNDRLLLDAKNGDKDAMDKEKCNELYNYFITKIK